MTAEGLAFQGNFMALLLQEKTIKAHLKTDLESGSESYPKKGK